MSGQPRPRRRRWRLQVFEGIRWPLLMLSLEEREEIARALEQLAIEPVPAGRKPLRATRRLYRHQCGSLRILYVIEGNDLIVVSLGIGRRGLPARYHPREG